jgi:hypothetical protein
MQTASRRRLWWRRAVCENDREAGEKRVASTIHLHSFSPCRHGPRFGASGRSALEDVLPQALSLISANLTMTRQGALFCARLLTLHESIGPALHTLAISFWVIYLGELAKVSNVDQPSSGPMSDHDG